MTPRAHLAEVFVSFQGEGTLVGRRHLFIRFAGCQLRCRYCDTPESLERGPTFRLRREGACESEIANPVSLADLSGHLEQLIAEETPVDGVALTGGEPLLQAEFIARLTETRFLPRPRLLETSGILADSLALVLPGIDVVSMDIKLPSNTGERSFWDAHARFLGLARGKAYVKIPVDRQTAVSEIEQAADLIGEIAPETPVFLQPICGARSEIDIPAGALTLFFNVMRCRLSDVRVLPQVHKALGLR